MAKKKSSVNKAGNYTKPTLRKRLFQQIKARRTMGTAASAGSTLSGQSSNTLTVASIHDINNTWRLLRIAEDPSNEDGISANCTVVVVANKSQWFGTGTVSA